MNEATQFIPGPGDALIVVDVQNDFLPGGALGVDEGDQVVPLLNRYMQRFAANGATVVLTRDWHPVNHCSFAARGGPWPPHCVQNTAGAAFPASLEFPDTLVLVSKASTSEKDAYSGFDGTRLADHLRAIGVNRVFIGGLATDYCVLNTVRDAVEAGFETLLLEDAIRAVEVKPGDGKKAIEEMSDLGATIVALPEIA